MKNSEETMYKAWARLVARAWAEDEFRQRLIAEPAAVLAENGVSLPEGARVRVVEFSEGDVIVPLPERPSGALSDEDLEKVAGGVTDPSAIGQFKVLLGGGGPQTGLMGTKLMGALYGGYYGGGPTGKY